MLERFRLDGQVALVTGGSRGIGLAIANVLGEAGARLVVSSKTRNEAAIYELEAAGYELHHIEADLSEPGAARADAPVVAGPRPIPERKRSPGRGNSASSDRPSQCVR